MLNTDNMYKSQTYVTSNLKNLANLNCCFHATKKTHLTTLPYFFRAIKHGNTKKSKTNASTPVHTNTGSIPPVAIGNTTNSANQQATIANTVVTAGDAITDVVSSGNLPVHGATNTDDACTTVDAAINIVNTTNNEHSAAGNENKTRAEAINDSSKASTAAITVRNNTDNGNIDFTHTTNVAAAGDAFVATAAAVCDVVVVENTIHAIINPDKTPTPNNTGVNSRRKSHSTGGEGAVDALVQVSIHMCTFFY